MKVEVAKSSMFLIELCYFAPSALAGVLTFTQGVALGYHISRLWR